MKDIIIYFTYGLVSDEELLKFLDRMYGMGIAAVELGVPFSDPVADGPVIQKASIEALEKGGTLQNVIRFIKKYKKSIRIPIYLMGYINSFYSYGLSEFIEDAKASGIKGAIIPDLPMEELDGFRTEAKSKDFALPLIISPLSTENRIKTLAKAATGFIYLVPRMGVTGVPTDDFDAAENMIKQITSPLPVYIGFGIHDASSLRSVMKIADGAIIGSAFIKRYLDSGTIDAPIEWLKKIV